MKINPTDIKVVIRPDDEKGVSDFGITIPDEAKEKPVTGTVIGVGPSCKQLKEGDRVYYPSTYGTKLTIEGIEHNIQKETDVYAVIIK